jgi:acid stress-induced BolA-like protein IbaG/YrbA
MDSRSITKIITAFEAALQKGAEEAGFTITYSVEQFGSSEAVGIIVVSADFEGANPPKRDVTVRRWLKKYAPEYQTERIVTLLLLTPEEAKTTVEITPASGAMVDLKKLYES